MLASSRGIMGFEDTQKARKFKEAYLEACEKCTAVVETEGEFNAVLTTSLKKLEKHDTNNKHLQTAGSTIQVGAAAAVIATGGVALAGVAAVGFCKWGAHARYKAKAKKHGNRAIDVMIQHHQARAKFIEAALHVKEARDELCKDFPALKALSIDGLAIALTYPGAVQHLLKETAVNVALYMAEEHPETTLEITLAALLTAVDFAIAVGLTTGAAVDTVLFTMEAIPFVGIAINLEKLRRARKAQKFGSQEAAELREKYEESKAHLESMRGLMQQFEPKKLPTK
jgi:hypothetical protein